MATRARRHRVRRWLRRLALGLLVLVGVAIAAIVVVIHTDVGRELIRAQLEARLDDTFVGGARIEDLEGSLFGTLRLRGVTINGPDGAPAIEIGSLQLDLELLPLLARRARFSEVIAEDVDVTLRRGPDGRLDLTRLTRPGSGEESGWSVELPSIQVRRGHVAYDPGDGRWNVDDLTIYGELSLPRDGPMHAIVSARGAWRERGVDLGIDGVVRFDPDHGFLEVPSVIARAGEITVAGLGIAVTIPTADRRPRGRTRSARGGSAPPAVDGIVVVDAPAGAVAAVVPGARLPARVSVAAIAAGRPPWTRLALLGRLGDTPVHAWIGADLGARVARGVVATGALELAAVTGGALDGSGGGLVAFEAALGGDGELPIIASGVATLWGTVSELPPARAAVAFTTDGARLSAVADVAAPRLGATAAAAVVREGPRIRLRYARLVAATSDVARLGHDLTAVGGRLSADLSARGVLAPSPSLAVEGRLAGRAVEVAGVSARRIDLAIDAARLPAAPVGHARLDVQDLARGDTALGDLSVVARSRRDGKVAVAVRAAPREPWRVELDALVTPPDARDVVTVDVRRHRVRTATGAIWSGTSGSLEIAPAQLKLGDLRSARSGDGGRIAIAGTLARSGPKAGVLAATVDATGVALDVVDPAFCGALDAHAEVTRRQGRWGGHLEVAARGISFAPAMPSIDGSLAVRATRTAVAVDVTASSPHLGTVALALEVDPPADLTDVGAWRRTRRADLRTARLSFEHFDVGRAARAAGIAAAGIVDGALQLGPTGAEGTLRVGGALVPGGSALGCLDAALRIAAPAPDAIAATLDGEVRGGGRFEATATLAVPARPLDPVAWRGLGRAALRGADVALVDLAITPERLARAGAPVALRGRASLSAEVSAGLRDARLVVEVEDLRGDPLAVPVGGRLTAVIDATAATAELAVHTGTIPLLQLEGRVPVTLDDLVATPRRVTTRPLDVTATLPWVPVTTVATLLDRGGGRAGIGGLVHGTIAVSGTVGDPRLQARIVASNVKVPAGSLAEPVRTLENLTVVGGWDGTTARLAIDGTQQFGALSVVARGRPGALGEATLELSARRFDLAPIFAFVPGAAGGVAGRLDARLRVRGLDPAAARLAGELHLTRARVPIAPRIGTLRRAKIDLAIRGDRLDVTASGRLGGGKVTVASRFVLAGGVPVRGGARIAVRGVSPIGPVEPEIDADIEATLRRAGDRWVADVVVDDGKVTIPKRPGDPLAPVGAPSDMVFATDVRAGDAAMAAGAPAAPVLIANVTLRPTEVESREFRGVVGGELRLAVAADRVGIDGTIEAERGNLDLFGRRYQVERARVTFDGEPDPRLDIEITYDFPDVTTSTVVRGRLSDPELVMSSDPGTYSQDQLLGFLIGGEPDGAPRAGVGREQAASAGTAFVANRIGGYVREALPVDIDVLRYEAATPTGSAAVTIGTWLTSSLFLAYRRHLEVREDENLSEAELEYWLARRLVLEGVIGDSGHYGLDLLWRRRY